MEKGSLKYGRLSLAVKQRGGTVAIVWTDVTALVAELVNPNFK